MFDVIINLKKNQGHNKVKEHFGSKFTKIKKTFKDNKKINVSTNIESLNKIINNVSNDVAQKNSAQISALAGASNTMLFTGIDCDTIDISGINQTAVGSVAVSADIQQSNSSTISTTISTTIEETITKASSTDLAALEAPSNDALSELMGSSLPDYNPAKANYNIDKSVKKYLELDNSFNVKSEQNVSNDIKNKIDQSNFASCQAAASAENQLLIQNVKCNQMKVKDIEQAAFAKVVLSCALNQSNTNEISTNIMNNISKNYDQIYDAIYDKAAAMYDNALDDTARKAAEDYYDRSGDALDLYSAAGMERIDAAGGNLPPKSTTRTPATVETHVVGETSEYDGLNAENNNTPKRKTTQPNKNRSDLSNIPPMILYGGIGLFVLIFILLIVVIVKK
jgi:hypothetical protein